jgi:hypothetical protein
VLLLGQHTQTSHHRRKGRDLAIPVTRVERGKPLMASGSSLRDLLASLHVWFNNIESA